MEAKGYGTTSLDSCLRRNDVVRASFWGRVTPTLVWDLDTHFENPRIWGCCEDLTAGILAVSILEALSY